MRRRDRGARLQHAGRVPVSGRPNSRVRRTRTEIEQCFVPDDAGMEYFHSGMAYVPAPAPPGVLPIGEFTSLDTTPPQSHGHMLYRGNAAADIQEHVCHLSADPGCITKKSIPSEHRDPFIAISDHLQDRESTGEVPNAETGTSRPAYESEEIEPSLEIKLQNVPQCEDMELDFVLSSSLYHSEALLKWQSILALLYTSGTVRYTVCQYEGI
jgi:hypothetical protein